jgi:colanic acid/amylovoran biosynthesis protein
MKVKSVLLVSYHSSLNNGDRALLEVNFQQINSAFDNPQITVLAAWPDEPYFKESTHFTTIPSAWNLIKITDGKGIIFPLINFFIAIFYIILYRYLRINLIPSSWMRLFEAYEKADVIASVSSTHFYSTGHYGWPFPVKIFAIQLAHIFNKPFYVLPQSIGPLRWGWEKKMLRFVYSKARLIFLRDQASMHLAEDINLPMNRVRFVPDPALAFKTNEKEKALNLLGKYGYNVDQYTIGLTLIPWQGRWVDPNLMGNYFSNLAELLRKFHSLTGVKVFIFNQVTGPTDLDDDRIATKLLMEASQEKEEWLVHVDEITSPEVLKACYSYMDLFIASRLHSGIFALACCVPTVFIGYMAKTRGMMQGLGLEDWVINLDEMNKDLLLDKVTGAWRERAVRREKLQHMIPSLMKEVMETGNTIRDDYGRA